MALILGVWTRMDTSHTTGPRPAAGSELLVPIFPIPPVGPPDVDAPVVRPLPPEEKSDGTMSDEIILIPTEPVDR
jgi:hypothetical protein